MESSLHRQLKNLYAPSDDAAEVSVDGYRIDAVVDDVYVEIQQSSLAAIRGKIKKLIRKNEVLVVKPLASRKYLLRRDQENGPVVRSRYSPTRKTFADFFLDFVHFVEIFPHPNLKIEILLTEQEEERLTVKPRRRRQKDYKVIDKRLRSIEDRMMLATAEDLSRFLPAELPTEFTTAHIAREKEIPRWLAQKMAYCLRVAGAIELAGKEGKSNLFRLVDAEPGKTRRRAA